MHTHLAALSLVDKLEEEEKKKTLFPILSPSHLTGLCPLTGMQSVQVLWQNQL